MKVPAWLQTGGGVYYFSDPDFSDCLIEKNPKRFLASPYWLAARLTAKR